MSKIVRAVGPFFETETVLVRWRTRSGEIVTYEITIPPRSVVQRRNHIQQERKDALFTEAPCTNTPQP